MAHKKDASMVVKVNSSTSLASSFPLILGSTMSSGGTSHLETTHPHAPSSHQKNTNVRFSSKAPLMDMLA